MIGFALIALLTASPSHVAKPTLDDAIKQQALDVVHCAQRSGVGKSAETVTIIDYGRASLQPRLWIVDLATGAIEAEEYVAHGRNSGDNRATHFSNEPNSRASSLGLFMTAETYVGSNGYSLRLDGLVPGVNDAARARAIVIHGAPYVDPALGAKQGRLGRSWGCPALRSAVAHGLIDMIKGGNFVFAYHPGDNWVASSQFGKCGTVTAQNRPVGAARASR